MTEVGPQSAERLRQDIELLAQIVTDQLFEKYPELVERYGATGRGKTLQDMRYNIEFLVAAVAAGRNEMFIEYVKWLDELLRARNVDRQDIVRCLVLLREVVQVRYEPEVAQSIVPVIDAGLTVVI